MSNFTIIKPIVDLICIMHQDFIHLGVSVTQEGLPYCPCFEVADDFAFGLRNYSGLGHLGILNTLVIVAAVYGIDVCLGDRHLLLKLPLGS